MNIPEDSPPKKRARVSVEEGSSDCLRRDKEFWYDDGTITLIAGHVKFSVYRGPLAKHSRVFRDMLPLPHSQPQNRGPRVSTSETDQMVECPVVRLQDSPEDLRHMLRVFSPGAPGSTKEVSDVSIECTFCSYFYFTDY